MAYSRQFTEGQIMATAGFQLNPGHSDLDDVQSMCVRLHDGLWVPDDLRCTLGDIRQAKRDVRTALKRFAASSNGSAINSVSRASPSSPSDSPPATFKIWSSISNAEPL